MRIITGSLKGRRLEAVSGKGTRPTSDKIREAIFQMLGPFFNGGLCLDLFAGSGALGIESISRGIDKAIFVDTSKQAIKTIHKNVDNLGIKSNAEIFRNEATRALKVLNKRNLTFDLICLDPPYGKLSLEKVVDFIEKNALLNENGLIYCEHSEDDIIDLSFTKYRLIKDIRFNKTTHIKILHNINE